MSTLYVVMRKEYQYNDEINYAEGDGGKPVEAFRDKNKAERAAMKANADEIKGGFGGYWYDINDILEVELEEFRKILASVGGSYSEDDYEVKLPEKLPLSDAEKVLKAINLEWYVVAPVEADL